MSDPSPWMRLALDEATRAAHVSPNPSVGCVIVAGGAVVGRGYTQPPGGDHAEAAALKDAGALARGAAAYVTLEPCSHWGRTPPCAGALIDAGVAEVHCALVDPDADVRGRGIELLRGAGIAVTVGDGAESARRQLAAYITQRVTGRPLVTAKFAASLDGKIATRTGDSRWVSGEAARAWTRAARGRIDAILVGCGTVLADDPQLTARAADGALLPHQPLRVVLDSAGSTPPSARVLEPPAHTMIATTERSSAAWRQAIERAGGEVVVPPTFGSRVSLEAVLDELGRRRVLSLLVEGGGTVHGAFFDAGLVDRVQAIIAPLIVGGDAPSAVAGAGVERMAAAWRLHDIEVERLDEDVIITGALREVPAIASMPGAEGDT